MTAARSDRRSALVNLLRRSGAPSSVADLADELGVHPNTVRFHLGALIEQGRVERIVGLSTGPGRPPLGYRLRPGMDPQGPTNYRLLATMLTAYLAMSTKTPALAAAELGRAWGPTLIERSTRPAPTRVTKPRAVAQIVDMLADLGFGPEPPSARAVEIRLRHCPFADLVADHAEVVCALH
ncbi:MAG: ArsR family transcriptional regulator, partial [Actinomycetota bacterium]|nr:ArsR family transcriptional regulator [Actinomycetota bacterium]